MSINVKGFKNQKNYQFFAFLGQKWHFLWDVHWKWPKTSKYGLFLRVLWKKIKKKSIRILGTMCVKMPSQISSVWLHSQNWQKICVFLGGKWLVTFEGMTIAFIWHAELIFWPKNGFPREENAKKCIFPKITNFSQLFWPAFEYGSKFRFKRISEMSNRRGGLS